MPPHHLSRRAQNKVAGWIGILIIVILSTATLFCIIVGILVCRRKRARRQRERKMTEEQSRPFVTQAYDGGAHAQEHSTHRYYEAEGQRGVELESNASVPVELQGEVGTTSQTQRHEVPAKNAHDVSPIEMPAHVAMR